MSVKIEFKTKDFEDFTKKIQQASKVAPDKIYEGMDKVGKQVRKELIDASPVSNVSKDNKKRLKARWKREKTTRNFNTFESKIRSTAPHFHLVERGHKLVKGSTQIGFVQGSRFAEKTLDRLEPEIYGSYEDMIDKILGDAFG